MCCQKRFIPFPSFLPLFHFPFRLPPFLPLFPFSQTAAPSLPISYLSLSSFLSLSLLPPLLLSFLSTSHPFFFPYFHPPFLLPFVPSSFPPCLTPSPPCFFLFCCLHPTFLPTIHSYLVPSTPFLLSLSLSFLHFEFQLTRLIFPH